ncbi:MAG: cytochrome C [Deltaproteobacteria bacterium]|nr:MAG: cytochrome C [Deltaproteobacteria bacterium]
MALKTEIKIAYGVVIYFLFVGILSYTVFSADSPETPIRVMYKSATGKVLFDHKTHSGDTGYGLACKDCHHHPMEDDTDYRACGQCHIPGKAESLPKSCLECHDADEIEDTEMLNSGDAFHGQCIGCHQEFGRGPVDCAECHVK